MCAGCHNREGISPVFGVVDEAMGPMDTAGADRLGELWIRSDQKRQSSNTGDFRQIFCNLIAIGATKVTIDDAPLARQAIGNARWIWGTVWVCQE